MKKSLFSLLLLGISMCTFAQSDEIKPGSFGFNFGFFDFPTAAKIKNQSLSDAFKGGSWHDLNQLSPTFTIQYVKGITSHIDWELQYAGSFPKSLNLNDHPVQSENTYFQSLDLTANIKLLKEPAVVNPFLTAGIGGYNYGKSFGAELPLGLGIQVNLGDNVDIVTQAQDRIDLSTKGADHVSYSLGVLFAINHKPKPVVYTPPPPPPQPVDTDGDGVADSVDACPTVAGLASLQGCPDKDGDGIADKDDKCPDVAGLAKYNGCPIPDSDGDGINDEQDKCPNVAGIAKYQGCPIPDTDADGVNDEVDKCPSVPGPVSNFGCPVIDSNIVMKVNYAAKSLYFATGKYTLLSKSYPALNLVAKVLTDDKTLNVDISGYTDNVGKPESNQALSENRANAVRDYLIKKGVDGDRITAKGFGEENALFDNKNASGRARNRRVEMKLRNY